MSQEETMESVDSQEVQGTEPASQTHRMSIALTIGATIALIGLILVLYGLFGSADYAHSDGININLWWGMLMVVFGLLMAAAGYFSGRRKKAH